MRGSLDFAGGSVHSPAMTEHEIAKAIALGLFPMLWAFLIGFVLWLVRRLLPRHEKWLFAPVWSTVGRMLRRLIGRRPA